VGLAPEDLNSIELLAQAIGNDATYFQTVAEGLAAKADAADVAADFATLAGVVDTKASSSSVAAADVALQEQIDTKASTDSVAQLSSQVATKQPALLQVPTDAATEELLEGSFLKGLYGVAPVDVTTHLSLDPTDTKTGHIRLSLDPNFTASIAYQEDVDTALAQKADTTALTAGLEASSAALAAATADF